MLTEICAYLRNYFDRDSYGNRLPSWEEEIEISDGELVGFADRLLPGQYYRIIDSMLNDGVYRYGDAGLTDETFRGTVQAMAIPAPVVEAAQRLKEHRTKYGEALDSPFSAESYFGYSWTKDTSDSANSTPGIPASIAASLSPWRKI